jgi:cell division septation protein DedD
MSHRKTSAMTRLMRVALLTAAAGSMTLGETAALADVRAGVTAWEAGDYNRAVTEWRPLAVQGDADAQFNIGQAYKLGRGVPQDFNEAVAWFRRAADQGHLQSEDNLGLVLYEMGQKADALPWLQRSASRGEPRAQYVLGAELFNGERLSRDWVRAYAFMKRASDAGLQRASAALVQMDQHIPLEQRQQGLSLAQTMEQTEGQTRMSAMTATMPAAAPTRAPTVRPAPVPPSQPGVSYAPPPLSGPVEVASLPPSSAPPVSRPPIGTPVGEGELRPGLSATAGVNVHQGVPAAARANVHSGVPAGVTTPVPVARRTTPVPAASPSAPATSARGAWRIQLGAFGDRGRATALWNRVSGRLGSAEPAYVAAGSVTRLQAGPYATRAAAQSACSAVRGMADCIVVGR